MAVLQTMIKVTRLMQSTSDKVTRQLANTEINIFYTTDHLLAVLRSEGAMLFTLTTAPKVLNRYALYGVCVVVRAKYTLEGGLPALFSANQYMITLQ